MGWKDLKDRPSVLLVRRMLVRIEADHLSVIAAGVAFYALLAIFPALAALVAIYGLLLDPQQVSQQIAALRGVLPEQVVELALGQINELTESDRSALGLGAAGALLLALWSASAGVRALIEALNVAYDVGEQRRYVKRALVSLLLTAGAITGGILAIAAVVVLPALLGFVGLDQGFKALLGYARWPIIAALVWLGLLVVYRLAPNRRNAQWSWTNRGAILAIVIWLLGSAGLSWYVENLDNFNSMYGSLGAVVVLLFWFLLSAYAVLLGAELNAELEHSSAAGRESQASGR